MTPSELVPSDAQRQTWSRMCDIALMKLGMADLPMPMMARVAAPVVAGQSAVALQGTEADLERAPLYQTLLNTLKSFDARKFMKTSSIALQGFSESIVVSNGANSLRMKPECARRVDIADIENQADVAGSGIPDFNSDFVANPEQAALAELRSVAVHELGHLFGMRHNFIASTTPGSVKDSSALPVSISTRTDSVMDYNDYAIDLGMGAMRDYSSPDGAVRKANFGIYDLLALNAIYGLDLKLPELVSQTAFCTDRNVLPYGDCQRDDYGKNHIEYLMHQINLDIGRMKIEGLPLDSSGGSSLKTRLNTNITALALEWYIAQDQLNQKFLKEPERTAAIAAVNNTFFAKDVQLNSVVKWQDTYGMPVLGLLDLLKIDDSGFKNPQDFLRKYDALIVRKTANESFGKFVQVLNKVRASKAGDMRYASMIRDVKLASGENFPFRSILLDHFSASIVAPANSPLPFTYFNDGTLKSGTEAKLNGQPVVVTSAKPFFNHNRNTLASKIQIDGGENGAPKDAVAITSGLYTVQDLKLLGSVVALLDPYSVDNAPLNRLTADRHALNCFSGAEVCADIPAIVPEKDKATSVIGARVLSNMYGELIAFLQNPDATLADAAGAGGN